MKQVFWIIALLTTCAQAQTYTTSSTFTGNTVSYQSQPYRLCPGQSITISLPDYGSNVIYQWNIPAQFFQVVSSNLNQVTLKPATAVEGTYNFNCIIYAPSSSYPNQNTKLAQYHLSGAIGCGAFGGWINVAASPVYSGSNITFIIPNYGNETHGVTTTWTYSWNGSVSWTPQGSNSTSISFTPYTSTNGTIYIKGIVKANGIAIGEYNKTFTVSADSGGGGGGCETSLFPNPSGGQFTLKSMAKDGKEISLAREKVSIVDQSNGEVVYEGILTDNELDISGLVSKSGTYIVKTNSVICPTPIKVFIEK